ncbi:Pfam:Yippee [Geosmithia morbida]|uniref:Pfam:Yippee n=1 Tax=Geosmithia morbida TaxID=1094350 RepID=A0A9P5D779_9HYPO|nr:Pfam:Yippee [Geosmithia morbida]KAF4124264.1 Pfam:Yippee [Geosmithia morbida]
MVRESGISATRPIFPGYLLPSLRLPFGRRESASSESSVPESPSSAPPWSETSTPATSPGTSPGTSSPIDSARPAGGHGGGGGSEAVPMETNDAHTENKTENTRLSRVAPDTLRCKHCSTDLALSLQVMSKGFTGRHGRALLVSPSRGGADDGGNLLNVRIGPSENRQLSTGWHTVADISCSTCCRMLGWKYVAARELSQQYKVGKYILETERVTTHRSWEHVEDGSVELQRQQRQQRRRSRHDDCDDDDEDGTGIVFNSDDEDECEDLFAGTWNAGAVAQRRIRRRMSGLGNNI